MMKTWLQCGTTATWRMVCKWYVCPRRSSARLRALRQRLVLRWGSFLIEVPGDQEVNSVSTKCDGRSNGSRRFGSRVSGDEADGASGAAGFLDEILTYPSSAAIRNSANQYIPFSWHVLEGLRLLQPRSSLPVARIMFSAAESPPLKGNLYHTLCKHRYVLAIYECRS